MDAVIVYKDDGTLQCQNNKPVPLDHDAALLRKIGASKICGQGNVSGPSIVVSQCDRPTGRVNAFAIPKKDWEQILIGIVGTLGFRLWCGAPYPDLDMDDGCTLAAQGLVGRVAPSVGAYPVLIRELLGRPCRCYKQGDPLTEDYIPDRVNIEHDENGRISDIWFG